MKISKLARNTVMGVVCASFVAMGGCSSIKNTWNSMNQTGQGAAAGGTIGAAVGLSLIHI